MRDNVKTAEEQRGFAKTIKRGEHLEQQDWTQSKYYFQDKFKRAIYDETFPLVYVLRKLMLVKEPLPIYVRDKIVEVLKLSDCSPPMTWCDAARIFLQERKFPTPGVMLFHRRH